MRGSLLGFAAWIGLVLPGFSEPLAREAVPAPLAGWISWVLHGHERDLCAPLQGERGRNCEWPGALKLTVSGRTARFEQAWTAEADGWAVLPGSSDGWPQDVRLDGASAPAVQRGPGPSVPIKAGTHLVSGSFRWDRRPQALQLPSETGLVTLTLDGRTVALPLRDDSGRLWFSAPAPEEAGPSEEQARLELTVHRKLEDDEPLSLTTRLVLKVSGPAREAQLGPVLPAGFVPISLTSALPVRLDAEGWLKVQERAGTWIVELKARREARADEIQVPKPVGWPGTEAWVFEAQPSLRLAELTGAPSLDPQQTELPGEWRSLPVFLVRPGTALKLVQRRRGEDPPPSDRLTLRRELWLDFDGGGFSIRDDIRGTLGKSWRLSAAPETKLGRVSVGEVDQFLTSLSSGGPAGLEVRTAQVEAQADSRVEASGLSASGWLHDFESVSAVLHLPPGWRIIHATGVDDASPTWVSRWSLLDIFLVLVAASAFLRLFGRGWGAAALVGIGLSWHEAHAVRWLWLAALLFAALHRALESHPSASKAARALWRISWAVLAIALVPFAISQARLALYPDLERPEESIGLLGRASSLIGGSAGSLQPEAAVEEDLVQAKGQAEADFRRQYGEERAALKKEERRGLARAHVAGSSASAPSSRPMGGASFQGVFAGKIQAAPPAPFRWAQMQIDPNARVSTGPGLPDWTWTTVNLAWKGPVPQGARLRLWLVPPWASFVLGWLRIGLSAALVLALAGVEIGRLGLARRLLVLAALLAIVPGARAAEFPPEKMLEELRNRLLAPHDCEPNCAESPFLRLRAAGSMLSLSMDVLAAAPVALPIPSGDRSWSPDRATLDGKPAAVRRSDDGRLWTPVGKGSHKLVLEGALPAAGGVNLSLPLKPRRVEAAVEGWTLGGLAEDGRPGDVLYLSRRREAKVEEAEARLQGNFPPFLRVERRIVLGLSWSVSTTVSRLSPTGTAVAAEIPLLPGEGVTSPDVRVKDGKAQVTLQPQAESVGWTSTLEQAKALELKAPETTLWAESWIVEPGPLWHFTAQGLPAVQETPDPAGRAAAYRPWPGEKLTLAIVRPAAVPGQTLTIDQSSLDLSPGQRSTDAALRLSVRTSLGGPHRLKLPEGSELLSAKIDGRTEPLRLEGRDLVAPLTPGSHELEVDWREPGGEGVLFRAPAVELGASAVNAHVRITVPPRWTLFAGGPGMGPAILFWSVLAVYLLVSLALGRTGLGPLDAGRWFLLSLGLTQTGALSGAVIACWFLAFGFRSRFGSGRPREFKLLQLALIALSGAAAVCLFRAITRGLLGLPEMQISGNGSTSATLHWYLDRVEASMPRPWVVSVPMAVYRAAMLVWALWLADSLIGWSRWAWGAFSSGGLWHRPDSPPPAPPRAV